MTQSWPSLLKNLGSKDVCLVLLVTLGCGLIALVYCLFATPVYRAEVLLLPAENEESAISSNFGSSFGGLAALAGVNIGRPDEVTVEALATIRSRTFLTEFIDDQNLKPILFHKEWEMEASDWAYDEPTDNEAYEFFSGKVLTVREDASTGLVTLQIDWVRPDTAAVWANILVERLNKTMRERSSAIARASVTYLEKEQARTSNVGTLQSISALLERQVNKIMIANVRNEFAFRVIDPAVESDQDDPVFPKTILLVCAGMAFGMFLSAGIIGLRLISTLRP